MRLLVTLHYPLDARCVATILRTLTAVYPDARLGEDGTIWDGPETPRQMPEGWFEIWDDASANRIGVYGSLTEAQAFISDYIPDAAVPSLRILRVEGKSITTVWPVEPISAAEAAEAAKEMK